MQELELDQFFSLSDYIHGEIFKGMTYPWEALERIEEYLLKASKKIEVDVPSTVYLLNREQISIGAGTVIEPGAYIQGPAIIGPNNTIRHGAYIRGNIITGEGCIIGHATEVKNSIFLNRVAAAHFNYVGDSILGNGVNLGAGVKLANFRLDQKEIPIYFRGEVIRTRLRKLGAIVGDGAQLGCNSVTNPGTLIGPQAFCLPCVNIKGVVTPRAIYKEPV
jgi:NDP-sugar pyrophosphorylase family protein